ncbi:MAG: glycosyltransferase [Chloroflexota bacterium]
MHPPDRTTTVAVVTTFHPEAGLADRLAPVLAQVERVLIVDNASAPSNQGEARALVASGRVDAIWNSANLGLAGALDQGLAWADARGAAWALLLDQDSRPLATIVEEAARVVAAAGGARVAAVGAGMTDRDPGRRPGDDGWAEERAVIASGTLIAVEAWKAIGGFRRDFFVDYVDLEFCLRARSAGYRVLRSLHPTIHHAIGHPERRRLMWRMVTTTHHDRDRRRSITRNRIVVWRTYWRREPRFVAADAWAFAKELVKLTFVEADRRAKVRAVVSGVRDGLRAPLGWP